MQIWVLPCLTLFLQDSNESSWITLKVRSSSLNFKISARSVSSLSYNPTLIPYKPELVKANPPKSIMIRGPNIIIKDDPLALRILRKSLWIIVNNSLTIYVIKFSKVSFSLGNSYSIEVIVSPWLLIIFTIL